MNKIKLNKKIISIITLVLVILLFAYPVYFINNKIRNYKADVLDEYTKLAELENEKNILDVYSRILTKGSDESVQIKKYILSNDKKEVLGLINELESYTKKVNLIGLDNSPINSVTVRENLDLTKYNANDLVVSITVSGGRVEIENFIKMLNNLPLISYIEKIDMKYSDLKNSANITLVVYQKNESK